MPEAMNTPELEALASRVLASGQAGDFIALIRKQARPVVRIPDVVLGPFRIRRMFFPDDGSAVPGHSHNYGHNFIVHDGSTLVECYPLGPDGLPLEPDRPAESHILGGRGRAKAIYIPANRWHKITALEPETDAGCYFLHRDEIGRIVPEYNGLEASYV